MNTSLNDSESSSSNENYSSSNDIKNQRIKKLYDLLSFLIEHRQFLKEKILLNSNKTYYFKPIYFMIDTY